MKVLVITYYWPPAGGSGVQRWLKFVKYFREFGIEPIIYTVENPNYAITDDSLAKEIPENIQILRQPIKEPSQFLEKIFPKKNKQSAGFLNDNPSTVGKIMQYIRANYFIPDARMFWIKPSVRFLTNYLKNNAVDAIITTGPPHSMHMIGLGLKKRINVKWLADFRDPWTEIDYFHRLPLSKKSIAKHEKLEQKVLKNADKVVVVGKTMQDAYLKYQPNTYVVTNGYDTNQAVSSNVQLDALFSITHIGLMNADRNPKVFWEVLAEIASENESFKRDLQIKLIGKVAEEVVQELDRLGLKESLKWIDYVPHSEVQQYQRASQVLLLVINKVPSAKGIITGKIFEYLQAKRPILAIGPEDGDLAEILNATEAGSVLDNDNKAKMKELLTKYYQLFQQNKLDCHSHHIEQYHRKELTGKMDELLKGMLHAFL